MIFCLVLCLPNQGRTELVPSGFQLNSGLPNLAFTLSCLFPSGHQWPLRTGMLLRLGGIVQALVLVCRKSIPLQNWNCFLCTGFIVGEFWLFGALIYLLHLESRRNLLKSVLGFGLACPWWGQEGSRANPSAQTAAGEGYSPWGLRNPMITAPGF